MTTEEKRIADLLEQFGSPLAAERDAALQALSDFVHTPQVQQVVRLASETDPDSDVRYRARQLYSSAASYFKKPAHPEVVAYLRSYQETRRIDLAALQQLQTNEDPAIRLQGIVVTLQMDGKEVVEPLLSIMEKEKDPWVLAGLIATVGKFGDAGHLPTISRFFNHESPRVVANAVSAAYSLSPEETFPLAVPLLSHQDHRVQANVLLILAERDQERFIGHLRLMAGSRKEAMRASALHCMRQVKSSSIEQILLEMFITERTTALVEKESQLLSEIATETSIPGLIRFAASKPEKVEPVRSILEATAKRLQWPEGLLESRIQEIQTLSKKLAEQGLAAPLRKSGEFRIEPPPSSRHSMLWKVTGFAALVIPIFIITWSAKEQQDRASLQSKESALSKSKKSISPKPTPSFEKGAFKSVTGSATILGGQQVVMKQGYTYYLFDFKDKYVLRPFESNQVLTIDGRYQGWDEDVGAVRMIGESVAPGGKK